MSLLTDGPYFLQPNSGSAVKLSYGGATVFAANAPDWRPWTPIAAGPDGDRL
jgi:hypothetical protein